MVRVRQLLKPGAELDLLTPGEAKSLFDELAARLAQRPATVRAEKDALTDAAGAVSFAVYQVPSGMAFHLTRLVVTIDGFTPAAPFTGAGAYLEILRNDVPVDFASLVAGSDGLPRKFFAEGLDSSAYYANGDAVAVRIVAGPANTRLLARLQGLLEPVVLGN
jgi:hypothetical protein